MQHALSGAEILRLQGFATAAMTFEAWLSTSDFCLPGELSYCIIPSAGCLLALSAICSAAGTIMSYTTQPQSSDPEQLSAGIKGFEISHPNHVLACPASHVPDKWPIQHEVSNICSSMSRNQPAVNILERDSSWHHLAVTAAPDGTIKTYTDGLLMTEVNLALIPVHAGQFHNAL